MLTALCFVAGAAAGALGWAGLRPTFAKDVFTRLNFRARTVPTAAGLVIALAVLAVEAAITLADVAGADVDARSLGPRRVTVLAVVGFALLGLLDDLGGAGDSGGFRGHLRALARGRLTTGAVKLFGGAALAVVVVATATAGRSFGRVLLDGALVALSANLGNLLDRRPGRVGKAALVAFVVLAITTGAGPELAGVAVAAGAGAALLLPDLRERLMLGDAGANVLGGALGVGVVLACSEPVRVVALVAVAALNVASELVSFSRVIDAVGPLRALDRLGLAADASTFDGDAGARFVAHYDSLRGRVRTEVVHRQLLEHLAPPPARVVDVGGGAGTQSLPLALLGYDVTILDPSRSMLDRALADAAAEGASVRLVEGRGEDAVALLGGETFDAVLCHGVVMYLDDPGTLLDALAALAAPGGVVSIVATNRDALADRPARRGDWPEAARLFDADRYVNGLGIDARADTPEAVAAELAARGLTPVAWYGVRVFTDAWRPETPDDDADAVLAVEWEATRRDPYRRLSRLFHLVATR